MESGSRNGSSAFVEENLRKTLHDKEQEIMELRKKKQLIEEEQMKKVLVNLKTIFTNQGIWILSLPLLRYQLKVGNMGNRLPLRALLLTSEIDWCKILKGQFWAA